MRYYIPLILFFLLHATCCREPAVILTGDVTLDELHDKQEIKAGLMVDCSMYNDREVNKIFLNGTEYTLGKILDLTGAGYYRIEVFFTDSGEGDSEVFRIVIIDEERGDAEWGLMKWTPPKPELDVFGGREFTLIHPPAAPGNVNVPLVVLVEGKLGESRYNYEASAGPQEFLIKSGVGSVQIPPDIRGNFTLEIRDPNSRKMLTPDINTMDNTPIMLQGVLSEDFQVPANSVVSIRADLTLGAGLTLDIGPGSFILIDPGVNLYIKGSLLIQGTMDSPVVMTCSDPDGLWGGIISREPGHNIIASFAMFSQSGYHTGSGYDYGHAKRQALFYSEKGNVDISDCFMIDHAGQIFYPVSSTVEIEHSLIQRAKTGGQINSSDIIINNSVFTDFPDDSRQYRDEDNDCLYISGSNARITGSLFMFAKDDGIDSGGSEGGDIVIRDTRFEYIFHEGAALSSGGNVYKSHVFEGCTFSYCGQGLELGYSSPNHHVSVDSCLFTSNGTGIRYGDNYINQHQGTILVSDTESILNLERDIWNMLRDNWTADTLKMQFDNVYVSIENPMYPQLKIKE